MVIGYNYRSAVDTFEMDRKPKKMSLSRKIFILVIVLFLVMFLW